MTTRGQTLAMPPSRYRQATGLTPAELECVVAILACQRAESGLPTSEAIRAITKRKGDKLCTQLVEQGVLRRVDTTSEGRAIYEVTRETLGRLGFAEAEVAA